MVILIGIEGYVLFGFKGLGVLDSRKSKFIFVLSVIKFFFL